MSRVRTGHGPMDWSEPDKGYPAVMSGSVWMAGEMVRSASAPTRERKSRRNTSEVAKEHRWDGVPRCGVVMPQAREACARTAGHMGHCKSASAIDYQRTKMRRYYERHHGVILERARAKYHARRAA